MDVTETPQAVEAPQQGTPTAPVGEAAASAPADDSLAAHEEAHAPERLAPERDDTGKFAARPERRRRAASQQADPDEVPVINELTKRFKTAVETHGKDITRKPGESERVFELRRRAEVIDRLAAPVTPTAPVQTPAPAPPQPRRQAANLPTAFPAYDAFIAIQGNEEATYEDYSDARAEWKYKVLREAERQQEAADKAQQDFQTKATTHGQRVTEARAKYADWDAVVTNDQPVTYVLRDAVLASANGPEIQYYLGKNRHVLAELNAESQDYSPSAVTAMRRYLDSLVAAPQRTSLPPSRAAAGSTGSALALAPPPAPRPPNPVRTGAEAPADEPPGDDSSLAAHEQFYSRRRR